MLARVVLAAATLASGATALAQTNYPNQAIRVVVPSANTPRETVTRLNRDLIRVPGMPEVMKTYEQLSMVPAQSAPEELGARVSREIAMWGPLVKKLNIALE